LSFRYFDQKLLTPDILLNLNPVVMTDLPRKKHFLQLPRYEGGSRELRKYISENLRYPAPALEARIEGFVIVAYDVLDDGTVVNMHVVKGLGYGCDEEALRLIGMLQFEKARNRGVRVRMTTKTRINFVLPKLIITYSQSQDDSTGNNKKSCPDKGEPITYNYTITR